MSDKPKDGGPMFPLQSLFESYGDYGLGVRDYFAAQALTALIAATAENAGYTVSQTAEDAYLYADAMMVARDGT